MVLGFKRPSSATPQIALTEREDQLRLEAIIQKGRWIVIVGGIPQIFISNAGSRWVAWLGFGILLLTTIWIRRTLRCLALGRSSGLAWMLAHTVLHRSKGAHPDRTIAAVAVVAAIGDTIASTVIMYNVLDDPNSSTALLPILLGAVFAMHWGPLAAVPAAGMSVMWQFASAAHSGVPVQVGSVTLRVLMIVATGGVIGHAMRDMRIHRRAAAAMFNTSRDLIATLDSDHKILQVNPAGRSLLGYEPAEWIGRNANDLIVTDDFDRRTPNGADTEIREVALLHRDGSAVWVEVNMVNDPETGVTHLIGRDVTQRRSDEAELRRRAERDYLTGVGNRASLIGRLERQAEAGVRPGIAFVDLDSFKQINDTYGHLAGDEVLVETARRLVKATGDRGWIARYGGDEFCVVATDPADLPTVVESIRIAMVKQFSVDGHSISVTATIGTASHRVGDRSMSIADLVDRADRDMYTTKHAHR